MRDEWTNHPRNRHTFSQRRWDESKRTLCGEVSSFSSASTLDDNFVIIDEFPPLLIGGKAPKNVVYPLLIRPTTRKNKLHQIHNLSGARIASIPGIHIFFLFNLFFYNCLEFVFLSQFFTIHINYLIYFRVLMRTKIRIYLSKQLPPLFF